MSGLFNTEFRTLEAALTARERLQSVHAANIANADTPNYHADTRTFADFLEIERNRRAYPETTQEGLEHFTMGNRGDLKNGRRRLDGNTVDIQKEMAHMAENQLMHELTIRLIKGRLAGLANAIKEGGR